MVLHDYQVEFVKKMIQLEVEVPPNTMSNLPLYGGMLALDMGMGKTSKIWKTISNFIVTTIELIKQTIARCSTNLIICAVGLQPHWKQLLKCQKVSVKFFIYIY